MFQNKHGSKYYSRYYTDKQNKTTNSSSSLAREENQKKLEQDMRNKIQRMNVMAVIKPEQSIFLTYVAEIFTIDSYAVLFKLID